MEAKFYKAKLEATTMEGVKLRFAVFHDVWMKDCKGCPTQWRTGEMVWQTEEQERQRNGQ